MSILLQTAEDAAMMAGSFLRENLGAVLDISYKGQIDLVTEMDRRAERMIVEMIQRVFPEHGIIAEEGARIDGRSDWRWIIDPLDGTTNYAHGYPQFAVSLGIERQGIVVCGVVYDPMRNELFAAEQHKGAFLNGRSMRVSTNASLIRSLLATGFPYDRAASRDNNINYFTAMIMEVQEIRRSGSAALDLCSVAAGRLDGYWELKLRPWDVAAGSLIVQEAGGTVTDLEGVSFSIQEKDIVASNGLIHEEMIRVLNGVRHKD